MFKRILKIAGGLLLLALLVSVSRAAYILTHYEVFKTPVFETQSPELPDSLGHNAVLVFTKTNSYRHWEAIDAANQLFGRLAEQEGWQVYFTDNGAIHNPAQLARFRLVIWNNNTGDVLTTEQQAALKQWLEAGGRWLGIHGAGGTHQFNWHWYPETLLKAQFIGHPMFPQFRTATLDVEDRAHPATRHLPARWTSVDEWYSFAESPRTKGVNVLASMDESTYTPRPGEKFIMGDHPLIWWHTLGQGTVFYSALGHTVEAFNAPEHRQMLENAARWLMQPEVPASP